jgi:membrane fusion protein, multidrug efflux system
MLFLLELLALTPVRCALLLTVASVALVGPACSGSKAAAPARGERGAGAGGLRVRVAAVTPQDVVYSVKALGSLEPEELIQVTAEVEGAVTDVRFNEGDRVTSETVLARIDPERYKLEAARAEAGLVRAEADARRARQELERREQLFTQQLVAVEELNRAKADGDRLTGDASAARAARDIALQNLRRADLRPPHGGIINTRSVATGQFVRTGTVLATLVDMSRLRLRFKVSETESLRAREGQTVTFRVAALGDKDFPALIYHVGAVADVATRQVEVMGWVKNPGVLKPGFFAEVVLATETRKAALVVPEGAVQASEKGFVAYVVDGGTAHQRSLQLGLRTGDGRIEIVSGLKAGESVVVEGSDRLADGVAVQEAKESPREANNQAGGAGATAAP